MIPRPRICTINVLKKIIEKSHKYINSSSIYYVPNMAYGSVSGIWNKLSSQMNLAPDFIVYRFDGKRDRKTKALNWQMVIRNKHIAETE